MGRRGMRDRGSTGERQAERGGTPARGGPTGGRRRLVADAPRGPRSWARDTRGCISFLCPSPQLHEALGHLFLKLGVQNAGRGPPACGWRVRGVWCGHLVGVQPHCPTDKAPSWGSGPSQSGVPACVLRGRPLSFAHGSAEGRWARLPTAASGAARGHGERLGPGLPLPVPRGPGQVHDSVR